MKPSSVAHAPFLSRHIGRAPAAPGVYLLYRNGRLIYIGLAAGGSTIRERLGQHLRGEGGRCTRSATEFDCEASNDPVPLYRHYVGAYLATSAGVLPDCNEEAAG